MGPGIIVSLATWTINN